jgi:hypothetical protein
LAAEGLAREIERLRNARRGAKAFDPTSLDERKAFERDYLLAVIDQELFWRERAQSPFRNPVFYQDALDPSVLSSPLRA